MKNQAITFLGIIVATIIFASCDNDLEKGQHRGEGNIISKELELSKFNKIDLQGSTSINIYQGVKQRVVATGHGNIIDRISTTVLDQKWEASLKSGSYTNYELNIDVFIPNLSEAIITGSGDLSIHDFEKQQNLILEIGGSGSMYLHKFSGCEKLTFNLGGSGNLNVNDKWEGLRDTNISIAGSGSYLGFSLETENAVVNISASGTCKLNVKNKLDVNISGSGSVFYYGSPSVSTSVQGSGIIKQMD